MLRILYDDFDQKVKNIDEMDLHHSYKKKRVLYGGNRLKIKGILLSFTSRLIFRFTMTFVVKKLK